MPSDILGFRKEKWLPLRGSHFEIFEDAINKQPASAYGLDYQ